MDCISPTGELPFYEQLKRDDAKLHYAESRENFLRECSLSRELDELFACATGEIKTLTQHLKEQGLLSNFNIHLVVRFLFSCLIDADRYETYCFMAAQLPRPSPAPPWKLLLNRLEEHLLTKNPKQLSPQEAVQVLQRGDSYGLPLQETIDLLRAAISTRCLAAAELPAGIYRLSVPTGGGKTLSSLRFALAHALARKKDRIFYIIPFTTIIDQNASVIRDVLGNDAGILEHHASVLPEQQPDGEDYELLTERWNSSIILTTMVQFLNTLFAGGTRAARRMHSLHNAVLVFDEIQSVPIPCIHLLNQALNFLSKMCNTTIVLCTATQPLLSSVERPLKFSEEAELIPETGLLFRAFRRTFILDARIPGGYSPEVLADFFLERMAGLRTGLAVLNTKKDAKALYLELLQRNARLPEAEQYHIVLLSTDLCPAHRKQILNALFSRMESGRVLCVSTQLIEAGVDISFQLAIRALAGLDSIAQTAGRCNRNAESTLREVYVVNIANENLKYLLEIQRGQDASKNVLDCGKFDADSLLSPEAMELYFSMYYAFLGNKMDYPLGGKANLGASATLYDLLGDNRLGRGASCEQTDSLPLRQAFATAGRFFEAIEQNTTALLVPFEEGAQLIEELRRADLNIARRRELLRRAQQYCVNVYAYIQKQLDKEGAIEVLPNGSLALDKRFYSLEYGITTQGEAMELLTI